MAVTHFRWDAKSVAVEMEDFVASRTHARYVREALGLFLHIPMYVNLIKLWL